MGLTRLGIHITTLFQEYQSNKHSARLRHSRGPVHSRVVIVHILVKLWSNSVSLCFPFISSDSCDRILFNEKGYAQPTHIEDTNDLPKSHVITNGSICL